MRGHRLFKKPPPNVVGSAANGAAPHPSLLPSQATLPPSASELRAECGSGPTTPRHCLGKKRFASAPRTSFRPVPPTPETVAAPRSPPVPGAPFPFSTPLRLPSPIQVLLDDFHRGLFWKGGWIQRWAFQETLAFRSVLSARGWRRGQSFGRGGAPRVRALGSRSTQLRHHAGHPPPPATGTVLPGLLATRLEQKRKKSESR